MPIDSLAMARCAVLDAVAAVLGSLRLMSAARMLACLPSAAMQPGGARIPGTSYELEPAQAAAVMIDLIGETGARFAPLLRALAAGDVAARSAILRGAPSPTVASLYPHAADISPSSPEDEMQTACERLTRAIEALWEARQARALLERVNRWAANPADFDHLPLQYFIAQFVRNAPP
jgi:hypothetical protein